MKMYRLLLTDSWDNKGGPFDGQFAIEGYYQPERRDQCAIEVAILVLQQRLEELKAKPTPPPA